VFIELIDHLRCINAHEDTWLVASFKTVTNRFVLEASLGCPSCSAQYSIYEGVADFTAGVEMARWEAERAAASHRKEELDAGLPAPIVESAVRAVRPGGRIVGPAAIPTPAGLTVLAHDDNYWVAQKAPEVITISRASR